MKLSFIINLKNIQAQDWEKAFEGIQKIVESYPLVLMRMKKETKLDTNRFCWTDEVFFKEQNSDCIQLKGEMLTLEYGATFTFYKDINVQMLENKDANYSINPFYISPTDEYFDCITGYFGFDILNHYDTCGHPYSYCILAIGMYLEHCFYENSYLAGDYNAQQIELVESWLNDLFETNICTPKTVDHQRLWEKIYPLYPDVQNTITRFWFLSKQDTATKMGFLLGQNKENTHQFLIEELKTYSTVDQWGVVDILMPYLVACNDLDAFILFFKQLQKTIDKEIFNLCELLKMIVDKGVCDKPFENEMLDEINKPRPSLETGMESLNKIFFRMNGLPSKTSFFTTADELLEIFAYHEPQNGNAFKQILDDNIEKTKRNRKKINKSLETIVENIQETLEIESIENEKNIKLLGLNNEQYFIQEAQSQKRNYPNFEKAAKIIGDSIRKNLVEYKKEYGQEFISLDSKDTILNSIYQGVAKRGLILTQNCWNNIDSETDIEILESIYYYISITQREVKFWDWRKFYLENNQFWNYLKSENQEKI